MAGGRNSVVDRNAALRRVAIVLASLPESIADGLLGSVEPRARQDIRQTMTTLTDVDPLERRRAIHAFKVSVTQNERHGLDLGRQPDDDPSQRRTGDAGLESNRPVSAATSSAASQTADDNPDEPVEQQATSAATTRMSFLDRVDDTILLSLLAKEHAQTVAVVLASIQPAHAARLLPKLDPRLQTDALSRIGRIDQIPQTAIVEVAEHLKSRIATQADSSDHTSGKRALGAILAAMPNDASKNTTNSQAVASRGDSTQPVSPVAFPSSDTIASDLSRRVRGLDQAWTDAGQSGPTAESPDAAVATTTSVKTHPDEQSAPVNAVGNASGHSNQRLDSTDSIHEFLTALSPSDLCAALGHVETRTAMLALCGLPNEVVASALATLPRAAAKEVRGRMNTIGSLNLREIDDAKEQVAGAAQKSGRVVERIPMAA